jgi:hypothetical protein
VVEERGQRSRHGATHPAIDAKNRFGQRLDAARRSGDGRPGVACRQPPSCRSMTTSRCRRPVRNGLFETMATAGEGSGGGLTDRVLTDLRG